MNTNLKFLFETAKNTFLRFPETLLIAASLSLYSIYLTESNFMTPLKTTLLLTLFMGLPVTVFTTYISDRFKINTFKKGILKALFSFGFLILFFLYFRFALKDQSYFLEFFHTLLIAHLLVSLSGPTSENKLSFWNFNKKFFLRGLLSLLYCSILYVGLVILYMAIEGLFGIKFTNIYYYSFHFIFISFFTLHFLSGSPKEAELDSNPYPQALLILIKYLLIPLVTTYILLLYIYLGKIILFSQWTQTYAAWLISGVSILGVFNILLISPLENDPKQQWILKYKKFFFMSLIPLLGMLFWCLYQRVSEFGLTEPRLILIYSGLCLLFLSLYFLITKKSTIRLIPKALLLTSLLAFVFPLNIYQISKWSQQKNLATLLEEKKSNSEKFTFKKIEKLRNQIKYLLHQHGPQSLKSYVPESILKNLKKDKSSFTYSVNPIYKFFKIYDPSVISERIEDFYSEAPSNSRLKFKSLFSVYKFHVYDRAASNLTGDENITANIRIAKDSKFLVISKSTAEEIIFDLDPVFKLSNDDSLDLINPVFDTQGNHQLYIEHLRKTSEKINFISGYLLLD